MRLLDARDLGIGSHPGEINGARVSSFGVACLARARGVRGDGLEEVDVSVVSSSDGSWDGTRGVDDGAIELPEHLKVVVNVVDWRNNGLRHGCFGGALRGVAGGGAHGSSGSGDDNGVGVLLVVVKIRSIHC